MELSFKDKFLGLRFAATPQHSSEGWPKAAREGTGDFASGIIFVFFSLRAVGLNVLNSTEPSCGQNPKAQLSPKS